MRQDFPLLKKSKTTTKNCPGEDVINNHLTWAVFVAQLVERLLPTPEIRGLNPDIGEILSANCTIEKTKIK